MKKITVKNFPHMKEHILQGQKKMKKHDEEKLENDKLNEGLLKLIKV